MIDDLEAAIAKYQDNWQAFIIERKNKAFFESLQLTAVGWKVSDLAAFDKRLLELRDKAVFVHLAWLNERWLADIGLREPLTSGVRVVKLMQRRPGSADAVGLDHMDFYSPTFSEVKGALGKESDIKWTEERNGDHCQWISIWFAHTEAKLRPNMALDAAISEVEDFKKAVLKDLA